MQGRNMTFLAGVFLSLIAIALMTSLSLIPFTAVLQRTITYTRYVTETQTTSSRFLYSRVLYEGSNLYISSFGYRYSGPYRLNAGDTFRVEWSADRIVCVYILNEVDWANVFFYVPTSFRNSKCSQSDSISYTLSYGEPVYVLVHGNLGSSAKLYRWRETHAWSEISTTTIVYTIPVTLVTTVKETTTLYGESMPYLKTMSFILLISGLILLVYAYLRVGGRKTEITA